MRARREPDPKEQAAREPTAHVVEAESFEVDGLEFLVFELESRPQIPADFTAAERAVGELLCEGHDIAEISRRRGVHYRTIANQLASMYRKAGVHSGAELVALLTSERGH